MTDHSTPPNGPDTPAAFTGLIVAAIVLFAILFSIVKATDAHFRHIEAAEAPAAPASS